MTPDAFIAERRPAWDTLARLSAAPRGALSPEDALRLGATYRATLADLAFARQHYPGDAVVDQLEELVGAGRAALAGGRQAAWRSLSELATGGYWRLVRDEPWSLALSALLLLVPALLVGAWATHDPQAAARVLPDSVRAGTNAGTGSLGLPINVQAGAAAFITANNIGVALKAFAGGIAVGLGTAYILVTNGLLVGGVAAYASRAGTGPRFIELVAPHGILELSCIVVGGAAGLRLGWALIDPGDRPRRETLTAGARSAVILLLGTVPYFALAAAVEGFVTPRGLGEAGGLAVGLLLAATLWVPVVVLGTRRD